MNAALTANLKKLGTKGEEILDSLNVAGVIEAGEYELLAGAASWQTIIKVLVNSDRLTFAQARKLSKGLEW